MVIDFMNTNMLKRILTKCIFITYDLIIQIVILFVNYELNYYFKANHIFGFDSYDVINFHNL